MQQLAGISINLKDYLKDLESQFMYYFLNQSGFTRQNIYDQKDAYKIIDNMIEKVFIITDDMEQILKADEVYYITNSDDLRAELELKYYVGDNVSKVFPIVIPSAAKSDDYESKIIETLNTKYIYGPYKKLAYIISYLPRVKSRNVENNILAAQEYGTVIHNMEQYSPKYVGRKTYIKPDCILDNDFLTYSKDCYNIHLDKLEKSKEHNDAKKEKLELASFNDLQACSGILHLYIQKKLYSLITKPHNFEIEFKGPKSKVEAVEYILASDKTINDLGLGSCKDKKYIKLITEMYNRLQNLTNIGYSKEFEDFIKKEYANI